MMKRFVFIIIATTISFFAKAQHDTLRLPELKFETLFYDFGIIEFENPVSYSFKFKNIGKSDLLIKNVMVECKCTTTEWSKIAYKKHKKGFIKITYNAGTKGLFYKNIIVLTNGKTANQSLTIKGFVR